MTAIAISNELTTAQLIAQLKSLNNMYEISQITPIENSISGQDIEIFFLQFRHFPNCIIYDTKGILLYNEIFFLQKIQKDLGLTIDKLLGILYIITLTKLPMINPVIKYII